MPEFRLLGPVEVLVGSLSVSTGQPRQRAVLAGLLVDAGRTVAVETVVDRVWGDNPPLGVRSALHSHIARIRQVLDQVNGDGAGFRQLRRAGGGYVLDVDLESVDLHRFRRLLRQSRSEGLSDLDRSSMLRQALGLWRGQPLTGLGGRWATGCRLSWEEDRLDAVTTFARAGLRLGEAGAVIGVLTETVYEHPLAEPLIAVLMLALHRAGRGAEALEWFARTRRRLADELGVDPGPELRQLHQDMLSGRVEPVPGPSTRPGPAPGAAPATRPRAPRTRRVLVGRADELRRLDAAAQAAEVVVVSGPAGVGATALMLAWAETAAGRFADGAVFADLAGFAPAGTPLTPAATARRLLLQLGEPPAKLPDEPDVLLARYRAVTAGLRVLVLLDGARSSAQVLDLIPTGPGSGTVVTSRGRLDGLVTAEEAEVVEVDPLGFDDAMTILAGREPPSRPRLPAEIVAEAAEACGGLPLALVALGCALRRRPHRVATASWAELGVPELDLLSVEGDRNVRAAIEGSLRTLPVPVRRLAGLIGLWPSPDIDPLAAAAMAGLDQREASRQLDLLADIHLIEERVGADNYAVPALVSAYLAEQAGRLPAAERDAAAARIHRHRLRPVPVPVPRRHPVRTCAGG